MPPQPFTSGMRSLTLHVSALNDSEYDYFTTSFSDLLDNPNALPSDDSRFDIASVSIREARAWLRGRYSSVPINDLDTILRTISPNNDALVGGQFFAVMRLITHVAAGKDVDGGLVFTQCHPDVDSPRFKTAKLPPPPPHHPAQDGKKTPTSIPIKRQPPPRPTNHAPLEKPTEIILPSSSPPTVPPKPTNPFINRSKSHDVGTLQSVPIATRTKTTGSIDIKQPPLPPRKPTIPPPPPPRHVSSSFVPPPFQSTGTTNVLIQQSLQAGRIAQSLKKAEEKLQKERVLEVLKTSTTTKRNRSVSPAKDISSSASASSSAGSVYGPASRPPPVLPPRRNFSPDTSPRMSVKSLDQIATASIGTYKPRYPTSSPFAREHNNERSGPPPPPIRSPSRSPPKHPVALAPDSPTSTISQPPPTHPDRKTSSVTQSQSQDWSDGSNPPSPSTRLYRSKSLHHPSPPLPPPVRRKRPESVQITPTDGSPTYFPASPHRPTSLSGKNNLSRHLSLSSPAGQGRDSEHRAPSSLSDSPIAGLQKTFTRLQQRAQPGLDAARFKAEAGLTRRGFVPHHGSWMRSEGEERLIDEPEELDGPRMVLDRSQDDLDVSEMSDVERSWEERLRGLRGSQSHTGPLSSGGTKEKRDPDGHATGGGGDKVRERAWLFERDDLKWPAGEGWKPLS